MVFQIDISGLVAFFNQPIGDGGITVGIVAVVLVVMLVVLRERSHRSR